MTSAGGGPTVSIVVVTYGTGPIVVDAVEAVRKHTSMPHELIVVDNPAPDGARSAPLLEGFDDVRIVQPDENLGFGGANDAGAALASGEYLCFLNPDVIVPEGWLEPLVAALADPLVGIAGPVFLDPDGSLQEAGQLIYDDACTAAVGGPEVLTGDMSQRFTRDVDYVSAACWVVRRSEHLERGGFDERFHPAFFEDSDYALRVEGEGRLSRLVADVPVVHHHGAGGAGRNYALAGSSQDVFRSIWHERLTAQPPRPATDAEALHNRDRLASEHVVWVSRAGAAPADVRERELAAARQRARSTPRARVTFLTDELAPGEVGRAQRAGVEVVVGDVDAAIANRPDADIEWHHVVEVPSWRERIFGPLWSVWTLVVLAIGAWFRVMVLRSPFGALNSDEAYTGLQAMGVFDGRFPVVVDGNTYSAVFEAYAFAPVVTLLGPSVVLLKLVPITGWLLASYLAFRAGRYLVNDVAGAVAGAAVWIAPGALLVVSTLAYVGYALGMAVVVATLWQAARLIDRPVSDVRNAAVLGALAGLGFYIHPMYLAVLVPITMPVAVVHLRQLREFWVPFVAAGLITNGPFLLWNAVNGWPSLEVQNALPGTYTDRLEIFVRELVPRGYGLRGPAFEWVFGRSLGLLAYAALVIAAVGGAMLMIRRSERRSRWLVPIALVAVWPLMALFSPLAWSADGRYNVISFPIIAIAVATSVAHVAELAPRNVRWAPAALAVAIWIGVFVWPHLDRKVAVVEVDANAPLIEVVDYLSARGFDRVAGSYWSVLTIEYATDREVIGAVSPPDPVRFPDRQREVEATDPELVAFVFPPWADDQSKLWLPVDRYERNLVGGTVVYLPIPLP